MKKNKNNYKLISHIAVLAMVVMLAVTSTFSWYSRTTNNDSSPTAGVLKYERSGNINGEGGTLQTYVGTKNSNGQITYDNKLTGNISTEPGAVNYFKTVITDKSSGDSLVSLYLKNLMCTKSLGNKIKIGILQPEKTYKEITADVESPNICTFKDIPLIDNVQIKMGTTIEIFWFIEIQESALYAGSISLGTLHLIYG